MKETQRASIIEAFYGNYEKKHVTELRIPYDLSESALQILLLAKI